MAWRAFAESPVPLAARAKEKQLVSTSPIIRSRRRAVDNPIGFRQAGGSWGIKNFASPTVSAGNPRVPPESQQRETKAFPTRT